MPQARPFRIECPLSNCVSRAYRTYESGSSACRTAPSQDSESADHSDSENWRLRSQAHDAQPSLLVDSTLSFLKFQNAQMGLSSFGRCLLKSPSPNAIRSPENSNDAEPAIPDPSECFADASSPETANFRISSSPVRLPFRRTRLPQNQAFAVRSDQICSDREHRLRNLEKFHNLD